MQAAAGRVGRVRKQDKLEERTDDAPPSTLDATETVVAAEPATPNVRLRLDPTGPAGGPMHVQSKPVAVQSATLCPFLTHAEQVGGRVQASEQEQRKP